MDSSGSETRCERVFLYLVFFLQELSNICFFHIRRPPCIESWGDGNDRDVKGVESSAGCQQSWWLHHPNQACKSEKLTEISKICFLFLHNPKEKYNWICRSQRRMRLRDSNPIRRLQDQHRPSPPLIDFPLQALAG